MNDVLGSLSGDFEALYSHTERASVDPAGDIAPGLAVTGVLFDPLGASIDGVDVSAKLQNGVVEHKKVRRLINPMHHTPGLNN